MMKQVLTGRKFLQIGELTNWPWFWLLIFSRCQKIPSFQNCGGYKGLEIGKPGLKGCVFMNRYENIFKDFMKIVGI